MDPIGALRRVRLQGDDELKQPDQLRPPPPAARDWDKDGSAAREFARNAIPAEAKTDARSAREFNVTLNDNILYLGMTSSAPTEIGLLRATGASVTVLPHATINDQVTVGGRDFDLSKASDALDFTHAIGLTGLQAEQVAVQLKEAVVGEGESTVRT